MRPTARTLALRDRAAAAAFGVLGADFGVSFGGASVGNQMMAGGVSFGLDGDASGSVSAPMALAAAGDPMHPANRQKMQAIWAQHHIQAAGTDSREALLEPNKNSTTKIQRYSFAVGNQSLTLGTALGFVLSNQPSVNIRPERFVCNVPSPMMVTLSTLQVANVNALVGNIEDAWTFNANSVGIALSLPTLTPSNKATVTAAYTGYVPPGFAPNYSAPFIASFTGWATIVA